MSRNRLIGHVLLIGSAITFFPRASYLRRRKKSMLECLDQAAAISVQKYRSRESEYG